MEAYVRYNQVVVWKKPGGPRYIAFLKRGDKVTILSGWKYNERVWKDKDYIKVLVNNSVGYILAAALSDVEVSLESKKPEQELDDEKIDDYIS